MGALFLFLFVSAAIAAVAPPRHVCIHDAYTRRVGLHNRTRVGPRPLPPPPPPGAQPRHLSLPAPIRIVPLYVNSLGGTDLSVEASMTPALATFVQTVVAAAIARWAQLLTVVPMAPLFAYRDCAATWGNGNCQAMPWPTCANSGDNVFVNFSLPFVAASTYYPSSSTAAAPLPGGAGLANADLGIFVTAKQTASCGSGGSGTIAYATKCQEDPATDRPTWGRINFCPLMLDPSAGAFKSQLYTALHEMAHVMAFSSSNFKNFRWPNNTARTPRDAWGNPDPATFGIAIAGCGTQTVAAKNTIDYATERGMACAWSGATAATSNIPFGNTGKQAYDCVARIVTPRVAEAAQAFFGCPSLAGAELENQDTTSCFIQGSHWESRMFATELMSPFSTANAKLSPLTLAVFEDSSWYGVNWTAADGWRYGDWGKGQGCTFATQKCSLANEGSPRHFWMAAAASADVCTNDMAALGYSSSLATYGSALPTQYQYFASPTTGSSSSFADYCPSISGYSNGACGTSANTRANAALFGEVYAAGSLCFNHSLLKAGYSPLRSFTSNCMKAPVCAADGLSYVITLQDGTVAPACSAAGQVVAVAGYTGRLECRAPAQVCGAYEWWSPAGTASGTASPSPTRSQSGSPGASGSGTASPTASPAASGTGTSTGALTQSGTRTQTGTASPTPTSSLAATGTGSATATPPMTPSTTVSRSSTTSGSSTASLSPGVTASNTGSNSGTPSSTATLSASPTATITLTGTGTATPPATPSTTVSGSSTLTLTASPSSSLSGTPTASLTAGASASATSTLSITPSATSTASGSATPSPSRTPTGTRTGSPTPTGTGTPTSTPSSTLSGSSTATASPTASLTAGASPSATGSTSLSGSATAAATGT